MTRIAVFRNPERTLVLVAEEDRIVAAPHPSYVGMPYDEAKLAACSVMRYRLGTELHETSADGYATLVELWPVVNDPSLVAGLAGLLEREAQWFSFNPPLNWFAVGPDQWCWSVIYCGDVVGFAQCSHWQGESEPPIIVGRYAVREEHRRRGHASAILSALDAHAERLGLPLVACVLSTNEPSLALCRKYFGEHLYVAEDEGNEVVVFGSRAEALR